MRRLVITVTALCALAAATPARAFGDLQNCDAIKDAGERMTCLYAHIAHLEQTLLSFSTDITDLRRALKEKLDANGVYKLQYVGKGNCLGWRRSEHEDGVEPAKGEGIGHRVIDFALPPHIRRVVEVAFRIHLI